MIAYPPNCIASRVIDNPLVIFEVTSESSVNRDWDLKLADYQTIPSLREDVLVDSRKEEIAVFSRTKLAKEWTFSRVNSGVLLLRESGLTLDLDAIYRDWRPQSTRLFCGFWDRRDACKVSTAGCGTALGELLSMGERPRGDRQPRHRTLPNHSSSRDRFL